RSRSEAGDRAAITTPVYFQFDRSEITEEGIRALDQKVDVLQRNPNVRVRIEGNADDSGSDEYNLALSQRRAGIVERYLTERDTESPHLLRTVGWRDRASTAHGAADSVKAPASAARGRFRGIHGGRSAPPLPTEAGTISRGRRLAGPVPSALDRSCRCPRTPPRPHESIN